MSQASILRIAVCALLVSASGCGKADSTASAGAPGPAPGQGTAADKASHSGNSGRDRRISITRLTTQSMVPPK